MICLRFVIQLSCIFCIYTAVSLNTCISKETQIQIDSAIVTNNSNNNIQKSKWAIVALIKPEKAEIHQRNDAIVEKLGPYTKSHDISIIFFSELKFSSQFRQRMYTKFHLFSSVQFIDTSSRAFGPISPERFGYKYMCKFFAIDMYDFLQPFDYYMRVDSDCYLTDLSYDIFAWAENKQIQYAFAMRKLEAHGPTKASLPPWIQQYQEKCSIEPRSLMKEPLSTCFNFYNNWHMGSVSFFRRPDVYHFLYAVNQSGYILKDRWGDSTIQAYGVRLFADPVRLLQVPNFTYIHGSHGHRVVSTFGDGSTTNVPQRLPNWIQN